MRAAGVRVVEDARISFIVEAQPRPSDHDATVEGPPEGPLVPPHPPSSLPDPLSRLTPRQIQIVALVARGLSVREIAAELGMTPKGVDSHKYRIMNRTGVRDRVGLTLLAVGAGLAAPWAVTRPPKRSVPAGKAR